MQSFHCRSREIWHVQANEVARELAGSLEALCNVKTSGINGDVIVILASCDSCSLKISIEDVKATSSMRTAPHIAPSSIVYVAIDYRGDCLEACRRLDLALFRGGG